VAVRFSGYYPNIARCSIFISGSLARRKEGKICEDQTKDDDPDLPSDEACNAFGKEYHLSSQEL
jgi:hypothetical protein